LSDLTQASHTATTMAAGFAAARADVVVCFGRVVMAFKVSARSRGDVQPAGKKALAVPRWGPKAS
jgi:hypothetical protein